VVRLELLVCRVFPVRVVVRVVLAALRVDSLVVLRVASLAAAVVAVIAVAVLRQPVQATE
jgi:hypothetical protein